jgi:ribonuclease M5
MIRIKQTVIVEGKYDKARLSGIIDAQIITTGGFDIYNDKEKRRLLIKLAKKNGIILLTDSDRAGFKIREHITGFLPTENVIQLYIPQREGKESRKEEFSKDGYLGVEGIESDVLEKLFLPFASGT